jgi:hypothetical protein
MPLTKISGTGANGISISSTGVVTFSSNLPTTTVDGVIKYNTSATSPRPSFHVRGYGSETSGSQSINSGTTSSTTTIFYNFSTIDHNVGSHFNNSTGKFTVPSGFDGLYLITFFSGLKSNSSWYSGGIYTNSADFDVQFSHHPENQYLTGTPIVTRSLVAGNEVAIGRANNSSGYATNYTGNSYLGFGVTFLG